MSLIDRKTTGTVFNVQKYSVHDGPGIRTIVFMKGCPLHCRWCSNPESQSFKPELAYNPNKCLGVDKCVRCLEVCTAGALSTTADNKISVNRELCLDQMHCADACPAQALNVYGRTMSVDEVLKRVEEDSIFYARSGGGLTLSGGEPLAQRDFALALLREARTRRIKTAIETCGFVDYETLKAAAEYLNHVLFDIKSVDAEKHKEFTGQSCERVMENLKSLRADFPDLHIRVRTPVIPGFNDTEEDMNAIVDFLEENVPSVEYEPLQYHRMGQPKYEYLGREYGIEAKQLDDAVFLKLKKIAQDRLGDCVK
ncbi:glycyl-radical enzyme activating protein [Desulfobaculum bizertense]|uniref:(2S)-3-sulfopropanediol dehydratase activating enzyme n=1 Tax=Desulfobaculum bizertense TaxID=376490 RepID=UPI001F369D86|nr:glycyl-radical enzyme activating protein [Desulfobaculum bizertense]UIJ37021.1 glycyl-radical enzyme activating protein [Desulfobaculum bizertense]